LASLPPDIEFKLLMLVSEGDQSAFRKLYDHYRNQVYYFAIKFLKSESLAEDVLQEIFSKIWVNRKKMTELNSFSKFLNTLTLNHIYNQLRHKAHETVFLQKQLSDHETGNQDVFNYFDLHELEGLIAEAVNRLPPQQKKVFELSRIEGLKHDEIANRLNISKETVKKHIMEALRNIKSFLALKSQSIINLLIVLLFLRKI
jgi:RNA polymerase sigma-70 factor (family 1)